MPERHWNLRRDPFAGAGATFVATPGHAEALARLEHAAVAGERLAVLRAPAGLGKSLLLDQALRRLRGPSRRVSRATSPCDGPALLATLAAGLGGRVEPGAGRPAAWRALADAARLCRLQGQAVVLAIDDCHVLTDPADRLDLDRLVHVDPHPQARVTLFRVGRDEPDGPPDPWGLAIRLPALTRSEAAAYLAAKLAAAGRDEPTFTPRAATRMHALAGGVPRGLDRLASLALRAGALRGLEVIGPEVVDGVAAECVGVADL